MRTIRDEDDDGKPGFTIRNARAVKKTERALMCVIEGEQVWIPLSQIHDNSDVFDLGHYGTLVVFKWWADKQGWEEEPEPRPADELSFATKFKERVKRK